jgi:hypothetical protein
VASALAWAADPDNAAAVDCLGGEYRKHKSDAFLGSSFLGALGLLALRGYLARTEALGLIARLRLTDNRFVLVCAAKVIGLLDDRQADEGLRSKLRELETSPLPPVYAEARYQIALVSLRSALLAEDKDGLITGLGEARDGFARAEISEELRPDAALLGTLTAVAIDLATLGIDPQGAAGRLREGAKRLRRFQGTDSRRPTAGYRSDAACPAVRVRHADRPGSGGDGERSRTGSEVDRPQAPLPPSLRGLPCGQADLGGHSWARKHRDGDAGDR